MSDAAETGFSVWYRPSRRHRWKRVASAPTECEANVLIGAGGHRHGHWITRPAGKSPNDDAKAPTESTGGSPCP
ncbi:unnamed protein product [Gemmataceae bacterium]|nr:unnamed protein product [Gemmataceae bacterium]VTT99011.1 unnamed protein product [Gemmataceae bacterium]